MATQEKSVLYPDYAIPESNRSFASLIVDTLKCYVQNFVPLTLPLLVPVLQQVGAVYLGYFISVYLTHLSIQNPQAVYAQPFSGIVIGLLIGFLTVVTVFRGFWHWMIYFASLNINVVEILNNQPVDIKGAYQKMTQKVWPYLMVLKAYFWVSISPFLLSYVVLIIWFALFPEVSASVVAQLASMDPLTRLAQVAGLILLYCVLTIVPMLLMFVAFSFAFQIAAFQSININPWPVLKKSAVLTLKVPVQTLFLLISLLLITVFITPYLFALVFEATGIMAILNQMHVYLMESSLQGVSGPLSGMQGPYWETVSSMGIDFSPASLAQAFSEQLIISVVGLLMLPLGTIAFTMLYFKAMSATK